MGFWTGSKGKYKQVQQFGPEQMDLYRQQMAQMAGPMGQGFDYLNRQLQGYAPGESPMEQMAMRQFREQTIPELSEQFAGLGATSGSGFGQQMGAQAAGLQEQMAGMRDQQQAQAYQQMMQMLGQAQGQNPYQNVYQPGKQGALSQISPLLGMVGGAMAPYAAQRLFSPSQQQGWNPADTSYAYNPQYGQRAMY